MAVYKDKKRETWYVNTSWRIAGKRHYKTMRGFKTKRQAQMAEIKFKDKISEGYNVAANPIFSSYYDDWVKTYKKDSVAPNTLTEYNLNGKRIKKLFGGIKIKQISRTFYQNVINKFGEDHAKVTVSKFNKAVRSCVRSAIRDGLLSKNFTDDIAITYNPNHGLKVTYLSDDDIKRLLNYLIQHRNPHFPGSYMILTALFTGLRESELAGLYWNDLDFKNHTLTVRRAWVYSEKQYGPTKNKTSSRTIGIAPQMLTMLKELKINDKKRVFWSKARAGFPNTHSLNRVLRHALRALNIDAPNYHFHSLRHSQVAILLNSNVATFDIAQRLGHSSTKMVEQTYAYEFEKHRKAVNQKINKTLADLTQNKHKK